MASCEKGGTIMVFAKATKRKNAKKGVGAALPSIKLSLQTMYASTVSDAESIAYADADARDGLEAMLKQLGRTSRGVQ